MIQKIVNMNSSSIQIDKGIRFVQRQTCWCCSSLDLQLLVLFFSSCHYRWMKLLASSRDEPAIRYEMEKYGYTGVAFAKHRPMIKLEWDSIEVYCKRIQLENSLWGESCVYLWRFGLCGFYSPGLHCLNEYLHS